MPIPQNVLDALNQAENDKEAAATADAATVAAQAALTTAQQQSATADQASTASRNTAIQVVTAWLDGTTTGTPPTPPQPQA